MEKKIAKLEGNVEDEVALTLVLTLPPRLRLFIFPVSLVCADLKIYISTMRGKKNKATVAPLKHTEALSASGCQRELKMATGSQQTGAEPSSADGGQACLDGCFRRQQLVSVEMD